MGAPRRGLVLGAAFVASVIVIVLAGACGDDPSGQRCSDIPTGGCPLSQGVACADPACDAVYACNGGTSWTLAQLCPPHEAGVVHDTGVPDAPAEATNIVDASIDAPPGAFGGPGCADLEMPDCSLGVALACTAACCGCEDLYVCERGGWSLWGKCGANGPTRD